jgi:hypothetical protein
MGEETWELPPAEHPVGVYFGLILSSIILGVGSFVLFLSIFAIFKTEGFRLTSQFIGRLLLFFASTYGAVASISALYNIVRFQRLHSKKVEKEFKNFTYYARPLVEEVIRQRLVSQNVSEHLEQMKKAKEFKRESEMGSTKWNETLILIAILGNLTVGLYLFHDRNPWVFVPYSLILLALAWWVVIARHFDFMDDPRSYYIPAIYVLLVPSLSIVFRGYLPQEQVLFIVFFLLLPYILGMYTYYSHIVLGRLPSFIPERYRGPESQEEAVEDIVNNYDKERPNRLHEFMPPKNKGD